jgi:hypothetical protein
LAAEGEPYDYINLLSGQDYLAWPAAEPRLLNGMLGSLSS